MSNKQQITRRSQKSLARNTFQTLESRNLLATISLTNGQLLLGGDTGDDVASVVASGGNVTASLTGVESMSFSAGSVDSIVFVGLGGDDQFTNETSIPSTAFGQAGNDTLIGGSGNDRLIGGPGVDILEGNAGDDEIRGGIDGKKTISGGSGNDRLFGGNGDNDIDAGDGDDIVHGGDGVDVVNGGDGDDSIYPGGGDDVVDAGAGNDSLNTGTGDDTIEGGAGDDVIFTGPGNDNIEGGDGDDNLNGGDGDDILIGGDGIDRLTGANGDDTIEGGAGADRINGGFGDDTIDGGTNPVGSGDLYFISSVERNYRVFDDLSVRDMFGEGGTDTLVGIDWLHFNDDNYRAESQVTDVVTIQPVIVSNSNGTNTAEFFGDSASESEIVHLINDIYYREGGFTQLNWLPATSWRNTNANNGSLDIAEIAAAAPDSVAGDPETIVNLFLVDAVQGISSSSENAVFGISILDASGASLRVGSNLLDFAEGRLTVARVAAHEIGHNLGLPHVEAASNLLFDEALTDDNLTTAQRNMIRDSMFAISV